MFVNLLLNNVVNYFVKQKVYSFFLFFSFSIHIVSELNVFFLFFAL
jgi:hypothetical protein